MKTLAILFVGLFFITSCQTGLDEMNEDISIQVESDGSDTPTAVNGHVPFTPRNND